MIKSFPTDTPACHVGSLLIIGGRGFGGTART
jgi:hypothetical protein